MLLLPAAGPSHTFKPVDVKYVLGIRWRTHFDRPMPLQQQQTSFSFFYDNEFLLQIVLFVGFVGVLRLSVGRVILYPAVAVVVVVIVALRRTRYVEEHLQIIIKEVLAL